MYNIEIMSKEECILRTSEELNKDFIIISINDSGRNTFIKKNTRIKDVCKLWFDDITNFRMGLHLMTRGEAENIKDFVDKYKHTTNNIIVHCTAGISRSGAVGCCLARYLNNDDTYLLKTGRYLPNKHVYKTMCEVLGLEYSEELFEEKYKISVSEERRIFNDLDINIDHMFCNVTLPK